MRRWLINFLARNTPSCKEAVQFISNAMEQPLSMEKRISIRLHLLICKWCTRYKKQLHFIQNILGGNPEKVGENTPDALSREAQERIKEALRSGKK